MTTIYHNPRCSTSRNTLERLRAAGREPEIIEYLKTPPSRDQLAKLISDAGLTPREAVRVKEAAYAELGLEGASDAQLLDAMAAHPILINRPFVVTEKGTRLGRPIEAVDEIL
ncbi:arsenate reductase (glutaredoxin) [Pusillimonas noertemannii]|uniref:Arsenate reductase n=1 Tax=Pusillimonas noertemannii TaxID=305977 RepID=A0A2U1CJJ8_9BURK|nr:arsenate reductase (glutaredoxin) [Pusillimonas noertemannii]PVY61154.1 arsenate reductase [Pusillimonas noertemannii]TFL09216.1 arsenate reductase (glutaredoxin) [Pusillimonas noertemannii]